MDRERINADSLQLLHRSLPVPCWLPWRAGPFCVTDTTLAPDDVEEGHRTGVINNRLLYLEVRA